MSYSVKQLAEMYNTTKQTIHTKLKHDDMKPYIIRQADKVLIDPTGINIFNTIMSSSKVAFRQIDTSNQSTSSQVDNTDYQALYIKELQEQLSTYRIKEESWNQERLKNAENLETLSKKIDEFQKLLPAPPFKKKRFWLF